MNFDFSYVGYAKLCKDCFWYSVRLKGVCSCNEESYSFSIGLAASSP